MSTSNGTSSSQVETSSSSDGFLPAAVPPAPPPLPKSCRVNGCGGRNCGCGIFFETQPCSGSTFCCCVFATCECGLYCNKARRPCSGSKFCPIEGCLGRGCPCEFYCTKKSKPCHGTEIIICAPNCELCHCSCSQIVCKKSGLKKCSGGTGPDCPGPSADPSSTLSYSSRMPTTIDFREPLTVFLGAIGLSLTMYTIENRRLKTRAQRKENSNDNS